MGRQPGYTRLNKINTVFLAFQIQVLFPARGALDFQGLFPFVLLPYYYRDFRLPPGSLFSLWPRRIFSQFRYVVFRVRLSAG